MEFSSTVLYDMISWSDDTPTILQLRFEDLVKDPARCFTSIFRFLGIVPQMASEEELKRISTTIPLKTSPEDGDRAARIRPIISVKARRETGEITSTNGIGTILRSFTILCC